MASIVLQLGKQFLLDECGIKFKRTKYLFCLLHKPQMGYFFYVFAFCWNQIDPGGFDTAVSQHVRQRGNVVRDLVKASGEQMSEIVREHFVSFNPGVFTDVR